jgi:acyl-CoA thioesterase FadM
MARLQLHLPENQFCYSTQQTVRVTDINSAKHLGNDSMISMISEARARFMHEANIEELRSGGVGLIVTDLAASYRAEAHARDVLRFEVGLMDLNRYGGDFMFRITRPADGKLIALAKSGFVFFDYQQSKVVAMPEGFKEKFPNINRVEGTA